MSENQPRGTPGLILLIFAVAMLLCAVARGPRRLHPPGQTPSLPATPNDRPAQPAPDK